MDRKLFLWSFNPSFTFKSLLKEEKPRCVILMSGTLVPLDTYENEFYTSFPIKVINDHVINKKEQVMVGILPKDHVGNQLNFSYRNRDDSAFLISFARCL